MGLVREGLSALRNDHLSKKKKLLLFSIKKCHLKMWVLKKNVYPIPIKLRTTTLCFMKTDSLAGECEGGGGTRYDYPGQHA